MNRIVISTPVDMNNFGNRLQNYAVHKICEKMGMDAVTIDFPKKYKGISVNIILRVLAPFSYLPIFDKVSVLTRMKKLIKGYKFTKERIECFESSSRSKIESFIAKTEYAGIGGDQIWSDYWSQKLWYCEFSSIDSNKKICFSPSFGKESLSEKEKKNIYAKIHEIDRPAVREISGVSIFSKLTGKDCEQIIDPVLMLERSEWSSIIKDGGVLKDKYILLYFLGNDIEQRRIIERLAEKNNWKIIDLLDSSKSSTYAIGPDEFIAWVSSAEIVFTDSYHGILLSMIMETPFVICKRKSSGADMSTRMDTIVELFHVNGNLMENINKDNPFETLARPEDYMPLVQEHKNRAWEYYKSFIK